MLDPDLYGLFMVSILFIIILIVSYICIQLFKIGRKIYGEKYHEIYT